MGKAVKDIDIAIDLPIQKVIDLLKHLNIKIINIGMKYGSITIIFRDQSFDITSFRSDIKNYGRTADTRFTKDILKDARRRDFTMNAIYLTMDGMVVDPLGGWDDLCKNKIKFVGSAARRVKEDYLRVLRFFRFFADYDHFESDISSYYMEIFSKVSKRLKKLSKERIWSELKAILTSKNPVPALTLMKKSGVLEVILPGSALTYLERLVFLERIAVKYNITYYVKKNIKLPDPICRLFAIDFFDTKMCKKYLRMNKKEHRILYSYSMAQNTNDSIAVLSYRYGLQTTFNNAIIKLAKEEIVEEKYIKEQFSLIIKGMVKGYSAVFPLSASDINSIRLDSVDFGDVMKKLKSMWIESEFESSRFDLLEAYHQL